MEANWSASPPAIATAGWAGRIDRLGFAIPGRPCPAHRRRTGEPARPAGDHRRPGAAKDATGGATVVDVTGGGPAEKAVIRRLRSSPRSTIA
ncbi:hypothetical protein GS461_12300 [Rhodococcus hoagii]|nr:hypothetical protein [Prescottella equi]